MGSEERVRVGGPKRVRVGSSTSSKNSNVYQRKEMVPKLFLVSNINVQSSNMPTLAGKCLPSEQLRQHRPLCLLSSPPFALPPQQLDKPCSLAPANAVSSIQGQ